MLASDPGQTQSHHTHSKMKAQGWATLPPEPLNLTTKHPSLRGFLVTGRSSLLWVMEPQVEMTRELRLFARMNP